MPKPTPWKDEYTLLCEKCGYVLEGLDTAGPCPECGKPIEESLPISREGSPWQRKASVVSLLRTWQIMLFHPRRTFDEMNSIEQDGMSLVAVGLIMALLAILICTMALALYLSITNEIAGAGAISMIIMMAIVGFIYWLVCFIYAWIAMARICWSSKLRGFRVSRDAAWAISGHASIGLIFPLLAALIGGALIFAALLIHQLYGLKLNWLEWLAYIMLLACLPVGLIVFEVLCSRGMHQCKYRNRIQPAESDPGATTRP